MDERMEVNGSTRTNGPFASPTLPQPLESATVIEYTVHELAHISNASVRTLHYYEEQGLLAPRRRENGYRVYGPADVQRLQQILLYRQADMPLAQIRGILNAPASVQVDALHRQLEALRSRREQLDSLVSTVETMIREAEGMAGATAANRDDTSRQHADKRSASIMTSNQTTSANSENNANVPGTGTGASRTTSDDAARFEAFKQQAIRENERVYGAEVRARYGDAAADASKARTEGMTEGQWAEAESQQRDIAARLAMIATSGSPEDEILGDAGRELCELHRAWLMHYWTPAMYSPAAHRGLAQMYVADERFRAFYDAMAPNGAGILRDAIETWAGREYETE